MEELIGVIYSALDLAFLNSLLRDIVQWDGERMAVVTYPDTEMVGVSHGLSWIAQETDISGPSGNSIKRNKIIGKLSDASDAVLSAFGHQLKPGQLDSNLHALKGEMMSFNGKTYFVTTQLFNRYAEFDLEWILLHMLPRSVIFDPHTLRMACVVGVGVTIGVVILALCVDSAITLEVEEAVKESGTRVFEIQKIQSALLGM
eukprot:gene16630-33824_t